MQHLSNPFRGQGLGNVSGAPVPSTDAQAVAHLLARCPAHAVTPLTPAPRLAAMAGVGALWVKDERGRMGLGSFKALGAAYVIACDAVATGASDLSTVLAGQTYITASAGNHGMSVAAGARVFGARAVVHIAETVPESFAERLREKGAEVVRAGADYETSMARSTASADRNGFTLLSDSSWPAYMDRPHRLMEGYLQMAAEALDDCPEPPTHVFLQAGVGGLAGAVAALVRKRLGDGPRVVVVEPDAAPAIFDSIKAGGFVTTTGPVSAMGRLDCKEASLIALTGLSRDADDFLLITEEDAALALVPMAAEGLQGSESGVAGVAGLLAADRAALGLGAGSRVLCFLSEGPA